ncbi:hypothetical protein NPIL_520831, partial [Nephila pilipes]
SADDSDILDAERIIRDHGGVSEQKSKESLEVDSEEEEDDMFDIDNYFYVKGKNRFR